MISKLPEPIIDKEKPFKNCKLDRQQYADILTKVVSQNHGCVFAIDGKWGSGKTTFVKMWKQSLVNQHFHVISIPLKSGQININQTIPEKGKN